MTEDLERQISKAEEKLSFYSSIPFVIIYGGFLTMIPLLVDFVLRMRWMTDCWVFFSLIIVAIIYIFAAIYFRNNAEKKFYSIVDDEKNFLRTHKICCLSNNASATDITTIKSDPSVEEILSQYKKYERKKLNARLELMVCGSAVFNIFYSMSVLIYTISTTHLFSDDPVKFPIGIRGKDVLDIIFFIGSFLGWVWTDYLRKKVMEHLLELNQKKYEQEYQKQC